MRQTFIIYTILIFGLIMAFIVPNFLTTISENKTEVYESQNQNALSGTTETVNKASEVVKKASQVELAIATPAIKKEEPKKETEEAKKEAKADTTTQQQETPKEEIKEESAETNSGSNEIANQLNKSLKSNLAGKGEVFAKYASEYGVDPYLATAIALHETGCNWSCSSAVRNKNNVGGMMGRGGLLSFSSLDEGIRAFIANIKKNYYNYGLTTPEAMNKKYAASTSWSTKVRSYMNRLKNA